MPLRIFVPAVALTLLVACGGAPPGPQETVALYLARKGLDLMRVLPMLTDDFHRAHGMVFANTAQLPFGIVLDPDPEPIPDDPDYAAERGRLGWLTAPSLTDEVYRMFPKRKQLQLIWRGSGEEGHRAWVRLQARVPDEAPVDFVFRLRRRQASEPWRIDAVEMASGSSPSAQFIRFLISPNLDCLRFIRREAAVRGGEGTVGRPTRR